MVSGGSDGEEKTFQPTERKLQEARRKGDLVRSPDISATAAYLGLTLALVIFGAHLVRVSGSVLAGILGRADTLSVAVLGPGGAGMMLPLISAALAPLLPLFLFPAALVLLSVLGQRAVVFSPDKLQFKLSRISPLAGLRNKFGASGLFEFFKALVKMLVFSALTGFILWRRMPELLASSMATPKQVSVMIGGNISSFLWAVVIISAVISVVDYGWQFFSLRRRLMMSRQEMKEETRESEGDPALKQKRREKGYDIATQRMMQDIPDADVLIVNPQHYAVALKWDRSPGSAPVCVAKGVDEIAARMREIAAEEGVPIHRDPPTARTIYATVEIGQEILPKQYRAVAAAIRYAEEMRKLARGRPWKNR